MLYMSHENTGYTLFHPRGSVDIFGTMEIGENYTIKQTNLNADQLIDV